MNSLSDVDYFIVAKKVILETQGFLSKIGEQSLEGFVFWLGKIENNLAVVSQSYIPKQFASHSLLGTYVTVDSEELAKLNKYLYENKLRLIGQVHSHPSDAYHSDTDNLFSVATEVGSISVVIPEFAQNPFSLTDCALYRLGTSGWAQVSEDITRQLLRVKD